MPQAGLCYAVRGLENQSFFYKKSTRLGRFFVGPWAAQPPMACRRSAWQKRSRALGRTSRIVFFCDYHHALAIISCLSGNGLFARFPGVSRCSLTSSLRKIKMLTYAQYAAPQGHFFQGALFIFLCSLSSNKKSHFWTDTISCLSRNGLLVRFRRYAQKIILGGKRRLRYHIYACGNFSRMS